MSYQERIDTLKRELRAIILAHNYQPPEVQDIADHVGDSLGLSILASETNAEVIVFCGVDFMAESAKILNPETTVLIPEKGAKCPMAAMCTAEAIREMRKRYPEAVVVGYVNSTAESKAEMDVCCTSANAIPVVRAVEADQVIFVPDGNLGAYVAKHVDKEIILWDGFCPTHQSMTATDIASLQRHNPGAKVMAHPECTSEVLEMAEIIGSTEGMVTALSDDGEYIVATERDMIHRLSKTAPGARFHEVRGSVCPPMKMTTLESIVRSLETMTWKVELSDDIIRRARIPLQRMIQMGR